MMLVALTRAVQKETDRGSWLCLSATDTSSISREQGLPPRALSSSSSPPYCHLCLWPGHSLLITDVWEQPESGVWFCLPNLLLAPWL